MGRRALPKVGDSSSWLSRPTDPVADRKHLPDGTLEKPRAVYLATCEKIAQNLAPFGLKYTKSAGVLRKRYEDLSHSIEFESSHYNIAGLHVALRLYAWVHSARLSDWRRANDSPRAPHRFLAGGMVHLLTTDLAMIEWELADPADRDETIADATTFLQEVVLPYLEQFRSPDGVLELIARGNVLAFDDVSMAEYAIFAGEKPLAELAIQRALSSRPELASMVEEAERSGPTASAGPMTPAKEIADLRRRYQLR